MDIAIINTILITFEGKGLGIVKSGAIGIEDSKITYVGKTKDLDYKKADLIIDGHNKHVTMPGLINAHTHSMLTLCRGTAHDLPELEYMPKGLSLFANNLKAEDFILGTKLAVLEGLKAGTTTFTEYGIGVSELIKKVYEPFQARIVATEMISELGFSDEKKPNELYSFYRYLGKNAFKRAKKLYKEFHQKELVSVMYGPNALDMISLDLLKQIKQQAVEDGTKIHMHIAQGERERLQITKRYGKGTTAVKVLEENNLLDKHLIAAHIHDTSEQERVSMVENGVSMVGCPSSIAKIDGIVPPLGSYVKLGGIASLGTDEAPGSGHHSVLHEIKMASILTKTLMRDPTAMPPWDAMKLATSMGAKVLGLENQVGSLAVGKKADVITLDINYLHLTPIIHEPFTNLIANLVYSSKGTEVDNVIINGKIVMKDRKILNFDENNFIEKASSRAEFLFEQLTDDWIKINSKMVDYHRKGFI
ncbi:MAG: amidohydrolase family protein [Candidatus Lokiarchaeota archaeon]|nr:amidohydrolase family protein [Candidatus Lokiarchaeota archaeon]MBD3337780.1 amidohydrolase family protein [Candidatus Lokiarchaeota archaeon]